MTITVQTLSDQAFEIVRERILAAELAPLTPIRQDALADELGISKIPLREALTRLEQHGLLNSHPNRGYVVSALSADEAEEVFALRLKIEPEAAAFACRNADQAHRDAATLALAQLETALRKSPKAARSAAGQTTSPQAARSAVGQTTSPHVARSAVGQTNATMDAVRCHRIFHLALVQNPERKLTVQLIERLHLVAERYVRKHLEPQGRSERADREHREMLEAWLAGDAKTVRTLLSTHLKTTLTELRQELDSSRD
jgi:DNA-binding GntR family transcriptional regulator